MTWYRLSLEGDVEKINQAAWRVLFQWLCPSKTAYRGAKLWTTCTNSSGPR